MSEEERKYQIGFVIQTINDICKGYNISLIPYDLKNGKSCVAIQDHLLDKIFAVVKE